MASRKFIKDVLMDIIGSKAVVSNEIVDNRRWTIEHFMIFLADDGKHYGVGYSTGATEMQDTSPFDDYEWDEEIECQEFVEVEKVVKVWEATK